MSRRASLRLLMLALLLAIAPACSRREVFESENAAKKAMVGKSAHDVIVRLGAPDSVTSGANFDNPNRYTECWKYSRMVRDRSTGQLKTFNIFFYRGKAIAVGAEK